ncbi:MAG: LysR family transcriptional regulator [Candidatus Dormibacteria bacterium]
MELRQLEYFVAVAEEKNFTRAAERVHISQSGVSAQIRQLERDLGATLFDRSGRTVSLTTAGTAALEHARLVLTAVQVVRRAVDDVNGLIRGRIVVGMVTACTVTPLFDALTAFHFAHPGVEITLTEDNSDRLTERVRTGTMDLALIGVSSTTSQGLDILPIVSERLVAAVPLGHPLAERPVVTLADISAYPIVCMPEGTGIRMVFDRACAAKGIHPDIALQASAPGAIADLAIRGLGIAILSESMAASQAGRLEAFVIDDVETPAGLALIWSATKSPALRELLPHCRQSFTDPRSGQELLST